MHSKLVLFLVALLTVANSHADEADAFFGADKVHEIRIYLEGSDWRQKLESAHRSDPEDPYFPARFVYGGTTLDPIGVRFKGNSSFNGNNVKKGFKFDFNEYQEGSELEDFTFFGLKKLTLNNGWLDPTQLRETLFLEFVRRYVPALRTTFVRLYVNDEYFGFYSTVEQPDTTFIRSRFGEVEDGNLYEGERSDAFGGTSLNSSSLTYLGPNPSDYYGNYELKTNTTANDWSGLVEFIAILNNTPASTLPDEFEPIADIENILFGLAANNLFANLDSYTGSAHNYYLYDRDDTGQFIHLHWDMNEAFGTFTNGLSAGQTVTSLDPFWVPVTSGGPGGGGGWAAPEQRPLLTNLVAVDSYQRFYLRALARMLREGFDEETMGARIDELAAVVRNDVYADPNYIYTPAQFEQALATSVVADRRNVAGLRQFVRDRAAYMQTVLQSYAEPSDVQLNELMPMNTTTLADEAGDYDPWIEIYNPGPGTVNHGGFYLTDDTSNSTMWALPDGELTAGEFLIVWLDGEPEEGDNHTNFRLPVTGGTVYLYHDSGAGPELLDTATDPGLTADESLVRSSNIRNDWAVTAQPTAGADNLVVDSVPASSTGSADLRINEFMADNDGTIEDPHEPGVYEDWIEIYNPGAAAVDMSGMYLTDNLSDPTVWQVPPGVTIEAGGYLLFWADSDALQGPTHTSFKLSAGGEEIGLYNTDGTTLVDSVEWQTEQTDIASGRFPDGGEGWFSFATATPGAANSSPLANWIVSAASYLRGPLAPAAIVSAFGAGFAASTEAANAIPLPTTLAGTVVEVADSAGQTRTSPLFYVSPGQINFQIPPETAAGTATVTIRLQNGSTTTGDILVHRVAPGVFSANATGSGVGSLGAVRVNAAGEQTSVAVCEYSAQQQQVVSVPVDLGPESDSVYLILYGTGIRGVSDLSGVSVEVDGEPLSVLYAAAQADYVGLDQVNVGPLPRSLAGSGEIDVVFEVDGKRANTVTVNIQ